MTHTIEKTWITDPGLRAVCAIIRGSHRCGYVEVPEGHPLYGVEYSQETDALNFNPEEIELGKRSPILALTAGKADGSIRHSPEIAFNVHGSLTYSNSGKRGYPIKSDGWWFGFDCSHFNDGSMDPDMQSFFSGPVRSLEYVIEECESLANQIEKLTGVTH